MTFIMSKFKEKFQLLFCMCMFQVIRPHSHEKKRHLKKKKKTPAFDFIFHFKCYIKRLYPANQVLPLKNKQCSNSEKCNRK